MDSTRRSATEARPLGPRLARRLATALLTLAGLSAALVLPASTVAATTTTPATDGTTSACSGGAWPASVQGAQLVVAGTAAGDHLWHDATGWHLRMTHVDTTRAVYTGSIHANRPLKVVGYRLEAGDTLTLSADHQTVTYRFANYGKIDGLDFTTDCATRLGISGRLNGVPLPARRVWLGRTMRHPLQNPFVILRTA